MTDRIRETERFLRECLSRSDYFIRNPEKGAYRLAHTMRVARIGAEIARQEGFDEEAMTAACLLHDVSYCRPFANDENWKNHGREAARMARPFLLELGFAPAAVEEMCYGIAIHVDDTADFPGERTAFALTVGDADNIDRFDAYRLYEILEHIGFSRMTMAEKAAHVEKTLGKLEGFMQMAFATQAGTALWQERIASQQDFYRRLARQLADSRSLTGLEEPEEATPGCGGVDLTLSGQF